MSLKTHFEVKVPFSTELVSSCGVGRRRSTNTRAVDCLNCEKQDAFILAKEAQEKARHERFMAQVPKNYMEPWKPGIFILCSDCGNGFFRIGDRTCYGHYENFHCAKCGHVESRLTETGMSF